MRFALKAVDAANRVVALELDASDESAARELARNRGYAVLSVRGTLAWLRRAPSFPTTVFSIQLHSLLDAGLNVVEALQALAEKEAGGEIRRVLGGVLEGLKQGETLSQAVARFPEAFDTLYVAILRASERTGSIKDALARYIAYREEFEQVRKKIVAALLYPAILIVVSALVLAFLMLYVVPRFARVYEDISTGLPFFSALLLAVGRFVEQNYFAFTGMLVAAIAAAAYAASRDRLRSAIVARVTRIPALGERMRVYQLARFYRTVGMLLRAGIPAPRAFEMVADLLPGSLRSQLSRAGALLQEGHAMSAALTTVGLTTPVATRMMLVGERSGQMGELMDRIAGFYDEETARFVDAFTRVFEPLLMAALGGAVGLVVVLMYMPVFELAGSVR
jgi:general secretion pathway protein F